MSPCERSQPGERVERHRDRSCPKKMKKKIEINLGKKITGSAIGRRGRGGFSKRVACMGGRGVCGEGHVAARRGERPPTELTSEEHKYRRGSRTLNVEKPLLHIWRCRHEYNPFSHPFLSGFALPSLPPLPSTPPSAPDPL